MTDNLCQKELDEFIQATNEWVKAAEGTQVFVVLKPLSPYEDIVPKPPEYYERMKRAYDKEEAARKNYFIKVQALLECQ